MALQKILADLTVSGVVTATTYAGGWNGTNISLAKGGTNASLTALNGGIVYSNATTLAITPAGTTNQFLKSNGAGVPTWTTLDLTFLDSAFKKSVRVATTANIALTGVQTIDGIAVVAGDRVLVKDQTTASQNGIYVVNSAAWSRPTDSSTSVLIGAGVVAVDSGTANGGDMWKNNFKVTDTLGTTAMNWYEVIDNGTSQTLSNKTLISPLISGNNNLLTLTSTSASGNNYIEFKGSGLTRTAYIGQGDATNDLWYSLPSANVHRFVTSYVQRLSISDTAVTSSVPFNGSSITASSGISALTLSATQESHFSAGVYVDPRPGFAHGAKITYGLAVSGSSYFTDSISSKAIGVNTSGSQTTGDGISLYSTYTGGLPSYGMMFGGSTQFGVHGAVAAGDWATYFTMSGAQTRGWIFRHDAAGPIASINAYGDAMFRSVIGVGTVNDYSGAGIEVRGNGTTIWPSIGFHQPGKYASSIQLPENNEFWFYTLGRAATANITAGFITAQQRFIANGGSDGGFENVAYTATTHNNIWRLANAKEYGIGYYGANTGGDNIGFHFGDRNAPAHRHYNNGDVIHNGSVNSAKVYATADGAANDPYGVISVTRGTASNFSYYGLTRAGQVGWSIGVDTSNNIIFGLGASGAGVISTSLVTISTGGLITAPYLKATSDLRIPTARPTPPAAGSIWIG
jgi:hypothetical protein